MLRTVKYISGGVEIDAAFADKVHPFLVQLSSTYNLIKDNKDHPTLADERLPFEWGQILSDTILEIVKGADSTDLLRKLDIPDNIIDNPYDLYTFMQNIGTSGSPPKVPKYQLELTTADKGFYERIKEFEKDAIKLEDYYEDAYKYIYDTIKKMK